MCQNCKNWKGKIKTGDVSNRKLCLKTLSDSSRLMGCTVCKKLFIDLHGQKYMHRYNFTKPTTEQEIEILCLKLSGELNVPKL